MKIYIIRHARVKMKWPKKCSSLDFDNACKLYDKADIFDSDITQLDINCRNIYVSNLYRSKETARKIFPNREYSEIEIGEVPLRSYKDCSLQIPLWRWNIMGRLQWFFNNRRQTETRIETVERCTRVINELESLDEDCIIVTHGFFMKTLIKCLKKQGYSIVGNKFSFSNLQVVVAESQ